MRRLLALGLAAAAFAVPAAHAATLPGIQVGKAPWPAERVLLYDRLQAIGMPALSAGGTVLHIHQPLDVFVDGRRVVVPAYVGIDADARFIAEVHTHDATGIVHVEAPRVQT